MTDLTKAGIQTLTTETEQPSVILGNKIARIVESDNTETVLVQWDKSPATPARHLISVDVNELIGSENAGREVLITFIDNDPKQPVITGVMSSVVDKMVQMELASDDDKQASPIITGDDENITITAHHQITLQCGKSSLILKKDGKIIVKGTNILSRASERNKIKGASVEVN